MIFPDRWGPGVGPDEAPAYCMICDWPIMTGPVCADCEQGDDDEADQ